MLAVSDALRRLLVQIAENSSRSAANNAGCRTGLLAAEICQR